MWSWRLSKIKKSLVHSNNFVYGKDSFKRTQFQQQEPSTYLFTDIGRWQYLFELFVASCVLAVVLVLAKNQTWHAITLLGLLQYILYINWVVIAFTTLVGCLHLFLNRIRRVYAFLISLLLLQGIVFFTTIFLNIVEIFSFCKKIKPSDFSVERIFQGLGLHISYGVLLGAFCLRYLYVRDQVIKRQKSELEARIQAMQARIQPHFLFNSLNSVVSLISIDPEKAEEVLINLSKLFRVSFQKLRLVSLQEEIKICEQYIFIEQIRLGNRLQISWRLPKPEILEQVQIPLLTLQPLLENSIFHGVEKVSGLCRISILIEILDGQINIIIMNPYQKDRRKIRPGHGIALENIKQRLKAYYGRRASLESFAGENVFTIILSYKYLKNDE